jgi:hypothetical protein
MLCKVNGCRYSKTHITKAHKCGNCGLFGHGKMECGNAELIKDLNTNDTEPFIICCIENCKDRTTHTIEGHKCNFCGVYAHDETECPEFLWKDKETRKVIFGQTENEYKRKKYLKITARNQMNWAEHKVYTVIYAGMGCLWFAKRDNIYEKIKLFFLHSDCQGQYGVENDDRPKLDKFLKDYECVEIKKSPLIGFSD